MPSVSHSLPLGHLLEASVSHQSDMADEVQELIGLLSNSQVGVQNGKLLTSHVHSLN